MSKKDQVPAYEPAEPESGPTRFDMLAHYGLAVETDQEREMREWEEAQAQKLSGANGPRTSAPPTTEVPLSELAHNPFNPRGELTELEETAASLHERGQLQPLAVVRTAAFLAVHGDQGATINSAAYVVIDGNRRLAAARQAGLDSLRVDVNDGLATSAADILEAALIANVHRVDVAPLDQAQALQELVDVHGSQRAVAKRIGKSNAWVSQRLALLELLPELQEKVATGELPVRDGRRIGKLNSEEQQQEAQQALARVREPRQATPPKLDHQAGTASPTPETVPMSSAASSTPRETADRTIATVPKQGSVPDEHDQVWQDPEAVFELLHHRMTDRDLAALITRMIQHRTDLRAEVLAPSATP